LPEKPFNSKKAQERRAHTFCEPLVRSTAAVYASIDPNVVSGIFQIGPFSLAATTQKKVNNATGNGLFLTTTQALLFSWTLGREIN